MSTVFYMIKGAIANLIVGTGIVTTLIFPERVNFQTYGGGRTDIFVKKSSDGKRIVLQPLKENISTNFVAITNSKEYVFKLRSKVGKPHFLVEVQEGSKGLISKRVFKSREYDVYEYPKLLEIINKSGKNLEVNSSIIRKREKGYAVKGSPLYINGKRVL